MIVPLNNYQTYQTLSQHKDKVALTMKVENIQVVLLVVSRMHRGEKSARRRLRHFYVYLLCHIRSKSFAAGSQGATGHSVV